MLVPGDYTLTNVVGGEALSVTQATGTYATANIGTNILTTVNLMPTDILAGAFTSTANYSFPTVVTGPGTIKLKPSNSISASLTGPAITGLPVTASGNLLLMIPPPKKLPLTIQVSVNRPNIIRVKAKR